MLLLVMLCCNATGTNTNNGGAFLLRNLSSHTKPMRSDSGEAGYLCFSFFEILKLILTATLLLYHHPLHWRSMQSCFCSKVYLFLLFQNRVNQNHINKPFHPVIISFTTV